MKFKLLKESFTIHSELNPIIFNSEKKIKEDIRKRLIEIADRFVDKIRQDNIPIKVYDYWLVGSNAAYNYQTDSDIDVHIIISLEESREPKILQALYDYIKSSFNDKYDIKIKTHPVELYLEDINTTVASNGIYSLLKNKWIKVPKQEEDKILYPEETDLYREYMSRFYNLSNKKDIEDFIDELYILRKESLTTEGEYGLGNLIFKEFRNQGKINQLKEKLRDIESKELTIESLQ